MKQNAILQQLAKPVVFLLAWVLLSAGCSPQNGDWGASSTLLPGWQTIGRSAKNAALDPHTWVPFSMTHLSHPGRPKIPR